MRTNLHGNWLYSGKLRLVFCLVLFEYLLFIFSGVSFAFLHGAPFFEFGVDPFSWLIYISGIPQFIVSHYWLGLILDGSIVLLLLFFIRNPGNNRVAMALFALLFLFYISLMGYLTHRNYQFGFFIVFIPFIFKNEKNKIYAYEATRYYILIFYASAAVLKLLNNALTDTSHFSHMVSSQFTSYLLEGNTGLRTQLNTYIIQHPLAGYSLFMASFIFELFAVIGFFTKRFDKWIAGLLLCFHFMSWLIMDIAPFGQIGLISLLFISSSILNISGSTIDKMRAL